MGDVTTDIKTRYSIYVPKPLARINLGDWQRREGQVQSPKFGYAGVSIQTEKDMFIEVVKSTYLQARGGFTVQTTDWFHCAQKALFMATADNATLGADGVMTIAAGAGQAPTWTLDHGDSLDVYPYNSLQLHYRVEEVQNSLFEFFRGRREKKFPKDSNTFGQKLLEGLFRKDPEFNSSKKTSLLAALNPFSDVGSNPRGQPGSKEKAWDDAGKAWFDPDAKVMGGFENAVETSWQLLFGEDAFALGDANKRAPFELLGKPMDDIRGTPSAVKYTFPDVVADGAVGEKTEKQLRYGFSSYFSRFDPYALINPDHPDITGSMFPRLMHIIVVLHNGTVRLKRTVDVMYKIGSLLKDNAFFKLATTAWQAVDAGYQAVKAARGQYEVWEAVALGSRGNLGDQFTDERESGWDKRIAIRNKLVKDWTPKTTLKAVVRSKAPEKDFVTGETKGFFGTLAATPGTSPPTATIAAMHVATNGAEFDLPAITVSVATAASIAGSATSSSGWTAQSKNRKFRVKFDSFEDWIEVDLGNPVIQSLADAQTADQALPAAQQHFVTDRTTQITNVLNLIVNASGMSGRAVVANGQITFTSAITGTLSKVQLRADPDETLGLLGLKKVSAAGTDPSAALTADTIIAAWTSAWNAANPPVAPATTSPAPPWDGKVDITSEDGQIVFTSKAEGDGAFVRVSGGPVDSFDFKGDFRGESKYDEVRELDVHRRGMDSFQKLDEELLKIPDDTAALVRPAILLYKNAVGVVTKTVGAFKALIKVAGLKLPQTKGAVGIVASKGISLGTPDRIVGVGGQGVVFIADGGTGIPDQSKYVVLEEIINRITGADLLAPFFAKPYAFKPPKPSIGFRAYSDTSTDLVARNTANVLALGRIEAAGNHILGSGVARVAASYGVEIAAQEKVVISARQAKIAPANGTAPGRVEVLGHTIAIGYNEIDAKEASFGLRDRTDIKGNVINKGWPAAWRTANDPNPHPHTASVLMHAADQACIVVGKYMVQLRASKQAHPNAAQESNAAQGRIDQATLQINALNLELAGLQGKIQNLMSERAQYDEPWSDFPEEDTLEDYKDRVKAINSTEIPSATQAKAKATAEKQAIDALSDEGIVISMRDPAGANNFATSQWAHKGKPAIHLNEDGITITSKAGEDDDTSNARITLDAEGISISWNGKAGVRVKNDNSIHISDGTNKAAFAANGWNFQAGKVAFTNAQKITLG